MCNPRTASVSSLRSFLVAPTQFPLSAISTFPCRSRTTRGATTQPAQRISSKTVCCFHMVQPALQPSLIMHPTCMQARTSSTARDMVRDNSSDTTARVTLASAVITVRLLVSLASSPHIIYIDVFDAQTTTRAIAPTVIALPLCAPRRALSAITPLVRLSPIGRLFICRA